MAISLIAKPDLFSPAYNPLKFIYDSTAKNSEGFRYVFDIYESGTSNKIAEYKIAPLPVTGYGEQDLSRLIRSKVKSSFIPGNINSNNDTNYRYRYDVKVGEEYVAVFNYTASLTNDSGNVEITVTHTFQIGDLVVVNAGSSNPLISGVWTVIDINGTTSFTISALWANVVDATEDGSVRYSDNRKTIVRDLRTDANNWAYDGVIEWGSFRTYTSAPYLLSNNTDRFLTTMPDEFWVTPTQDLWMQIGNDTNVGKLRFQNDTVDSFEIDVNNANITTQVRIAGNFTPTLISGTAPLVKSTTQFYDVFFISGSPATPKSRTYRIWIDRRCEIEPYEIVFKDRLGSWGSFAFQLRSYKRGEAQRETYNKDVTGLVSSSKWTYGSTERGQTVINPSEVITYELNTNYMNHEMAAYFAELVTSPETYLKIRGVYYACIVQDTSFEIDNPKNKNLVRKTIQVKLANQNMING